MKQTLFSRLSDKPKSTLFRVREIYMNRLSDLHKATMNFRSAAKKQVSNSKFHSKSINYDSEILLVVKST